MENARGVAWKFGTNIDTDAILPAPYLNLTNPRELAVHCFEATNAKFCKGAKQGDFIIANKNFGCGSSREHAPVAIRAKGIRCVIASSFARIFFRNSFNIGLPVLECPEAVEAIEEGDEITVDIRNGVITNFTKEQTYQCEAIPDHMLAILKDGGLIPHLTHQAK